MSASDQDELAALLALEAGQLPTHPPTDLDSEPLPGLFESGENGENSGQAQRGLSPSSRMIASPGFREAICKLALPALAGGATLAEVAAEVGCTPSLLRGWLISVDETAYQEALAGQIGVKLAELGGKFDECVADVEKAQRATEAREKVLIGDGLSTRYQLIGPELAKVARARAGVLSDAARALHWQAERRLPKLFAGDADQGRGPMRATFSFIVDGRPAGIVTGRTLTPDRPRIEQPLEGPGSFDIKPLQRTHAIDAPAQGVVIHSQDPLPAGVNDDAGPAPAPGEKGQR